MLLILEQKLEALEKERCNLKEEVDEGRHQMQAMKETTMKSKEAQEKLQTANSKLQFEMAESSRVAAERLNEAMRISRCWRRRTKGVTKQLQLLQSRWSWQRRRRRWQI